jgi:hypothetical protein
VNARGLGLVAAYSRASEQNLAHHGIAPHSLHGRIGDVRGQPRSMILNLLVSQGPLAIAATSSRTLQGPLVIVATGSLT